MPNAQNTDNLQKESPADDTQKCVSRKAFSCMKRIFMYLAVILITVALGFFIWIKSDFGSDFLDSKVQAKLQQKIGSFAKVNIDNARLSIDDDYHIALKIDNTPIDLHNSHIELSHVGRLRFGFATMPLLQRKIEVIQLEADNASVIFHKDSDSKGIFASLPHDAQQRVNFDAVANLAFEAIDKLVQEADKIKINTFGFSNIAFTIKTPVDEQNFTIKQLQMRRLRESAELKAEIIWLGQTVHVQASADLNKSGQVQHFAVTVDNIPVHLGAADNAKPYWPDGRPNSGFFRLRGTSKLILNGAIDPSGRKNFALSLSMENANSDISVEAGVSTEFNTNITYSQGSGQMVLRDSSVSIGGLVLPLTGYFGYPENAKTTKNITDGPLQTAGLYNFSLKSYDAVSSPDDSPAGALSFNLDTEGNFSALDKKVIFQSIALKTGDSTLLGNGSVRFGAERWPELIFVLHSSHMPVNEVKQLWPINISRSARSWVLSHIFGGNISDMQMEIAMPEGFYQKGKRPPPLTEKELHIRTNIENTRSDLVGTLPPLREAYGQVEVKGRETTIYLNKALAYVDDGQQIKASDGKMYFDWHPGQPLWADLSIHIAGAIGPIGKILACQPVNAANKVPFNMQTAKGDIRALLKMDLPLYKGQKAQDADRAIRWNVQADFENFALAELYRGSTSITNAVGRAVLDNNSAKVTGDALLNGVPATVTMLYPLANLEKSKPTGTMPNTSLVPKQEKVIFHIDDKIRNKLFPALNIFLKGVIAANVGAEQNGRRPVVVDLTNSVVQIPWIGWKKGEGIPATAEMSLPIKKGGLKNIDIDDFVLSGTNFHIAGKIHIRDGIFASAEFNQFNLNRSDKLALTVSNNNKVYNIKLNGSSLDMRAFVKNLNESTSQTGSKTASGNAIILTATIDKIQGFNNEVLHNFQAIFNSIPAKTEKTFVKAFSKTGKAINIQEIKQKNLPQQIKVQTEDAGAFFRFMNYYDKMQGGNLLSTLQSSENNILSGPVRLRNFAIINEQKLNAIVSSGRDSDGKINASYLAVAEAHAYLIKGPNSLMLQRGVMRSPSIGATFQGTVYDSTGNIAVTGTYMPIYSVNRLFGDVPLVGRILGNGRDKGLIGITFKLEGKFKSPKIIINPISAIAPGFLRSMFEFKQR